MLSPRLGAEYAYLLHCLKNAKAYNEGRISDFGEVGAKAPDERTLEVTLEGPTPYFLNMQIHYAWFPVHQAAIEAYGAMDERDTPWTLPGRFVGNGAFALKVWSPNEVIQVRRNPHYWGRDSVRLDGIDFFPIDNQQTEERCFRAGELDITNTIPIHKTDFYRRKYPELLHIHPYCGVYFYRFNVTRPPFDDVRVRRAFAMSIDRAEVAERVLKGGELPAEYFTPPDVAGYTSRARLPYDPEAARALLAEAGFPGGKGLPPIEILYNTSEAHRTIAEAIQRMWKEHLGADVPPAQPGLEGLPGLDEQPRLRRGAFVVDSRTCSTRSTSSNASSRAAATTAPAGPIPNSTRWWRRPTRKRTPPSATSRSSRPRPFCSTKRPSRAIYFYTWKYLQTPSLKGVTPNLLGYIRWKTLYFE